MGTVGAIGLFLSIVFHEMTHSLVVRQFGMPIKGITLFLFGGVAEMKEEPPNATAEFIMALAGPLSSIILVVVFYGLSQITKSAGWPEPVYGMIKYLAWISVILAPFNLVTAFPLDGGYILRAVFWGWKKNLRWATWVAAEIGSGFSLFLIFMGILQFLSGNFIGRMWWFFIGIFFRSAAKMSYSLRLFLWDLHDRLLHCWSLCFDAILLRYWNIKEWKSS